MSPWTQDYTPLGNLFLSALVAALPVVVLLGALAFFHVKAHIAALLGLVLALAHRDRRVRDAGQMAGASALYGAAFGLLPIGWIVLNAIFVYDITVKTGQFEVVKDTIAGLAGDRRIQVLLIAFSVRRVHRGRAGFGTPVAISAAMLIGLGFKPLDAAGLALIGNTAPVAYGALGTPIITLAKVTGLAELALSAMAGRQLPLFSLIVPFWLVWAMAGFRGMLGVWPACLVAGLVRDPAVRRHQLHGPWLVDIVAAASCIISDLPVPQGLAAEGGVALRGRARARAPPPARPSAPPRPRSRVTRRRGVAWAGCPGSSSRCSSSSGACRR